MIDKVSVAECSLCGSCVSACPTGAISYTKKHLGFSYPQIDLKKCVDCGKCEQACPLLNCPEYKKPMNSYEAKHKQSEIRKQSSSGGVFSALAQAVFECQGLVVGAAFQSDWSVKHICIESIEDLPELRGSKYVQSETRDCFLQIKKELESGRMVLFSGCPCQCAALNAFLGKGVAGKLFLVDFICHGMLSQTLFFEYLKDLEEKNKSKIKEFSFRDKTYGWIDSGPKVVFENGREKCWPLYEDLYMQGYFQALCMKEACYSCIYKNFHSGSDLTLGDFWGGEVLDPEFYEKDGVSIVSVQTEAGQSLLRKAEKNLILKDMGLEVLTKYNQGLYKPFGPNARREQYLRLASEKGELDALKQMTRLSTGEQIKRVYHTFHRKMRYYLKKRGKNGK